MRPVIFRSVNLAKTVMFCLCLISAPTYADGDEDFDPLPPRSTDAGTTDPDAALRSAGLNNPGAASGDVGSFGQFVEYALAAGAIVGALLVISGRESDPQDAAAAATTTTR